ncbi:MAG: hypothetical protein KAJ40_04420 [Alphaproteobacteria bacterium]|nr:hypothetical protein [Alphaproteobacteria bacterium]
MFDEAYTKLELAEIASILDVLNDRIDGSTFDALQTTILAIELPYYPDYRFLSIADHTTMPPLQRFVFQKNHTMEFTIIDWDYKTIQKLNEDVPISLNEENIIEYVRFYFGHVKGRYGQFIICETADHIQWKEEPSSEIKQSLNKALSPLELAEKRQDKTYVINAFMMLKDALFGVQVFVQPNGKVTMSDHEIIMEDIPVLDKTFMQ